jgi:hypothetical protein
MLREWPNNLAKIRDWHAVAGPSANRRGRDLAQETAQQEMDI